MEDFNKISLNDKCKIEDKLYPKGVVIFRDQNGNIVFKGNNMVVKSGRTALFKLFLGISENSNSENSEDSEPKTFFSGINAFIGNNIAMVAANDTYSTEPTEGYKSITSSNAKVIVYKTPTTDNNDEVVVPETQVTDSNTEDVKVGIPKTVYVKEPQGNEYEEVTGADINNDDFMIYYSANTNTNPVTYDRLCPDEDKLYYRIDTDKLYIHMGINYKPSTTDPVSTFGLYFGNGDNKELFSRIVFPKRTLTKNTPLIIDYYLYF